VPPTPPAVTIKGTICDADDYKKPPLEGVEVRLYDVTTGEDILVERAVSNPEYKFENLEVEKDYVLIIDRVLRKIKLSPKTFAYLRRV